MIFGKTDDKSMRIEKALTVASGPLTIDDICRLVFGTITARGRNLVRVVLHRLDARLYDEDVPTADRLLQTDKQVVVPVLDASAAAKRHPQMAGDGSGLSLM